MSDMYDQFLTEYPAFAETQWLTFALTILIFLMVALSTAPDPADQCPSLPTSPLPFSTPEKNSCSAPISLATLRSSPAFTR